MTEAANEVVVIDSGGANLASLGFALERLGARTVVTSDPARLAAAHRVLLPGVGAAGAAMQRLRDPKLIQSIRALRVPLLGICLGMQLLFENSDEDNTQCLGLLPGRIHRLSPAPGLPVPHMGWNTLQITTDDPLFEGIWPNDYVYFVHGYAAYPDSFTTATTDYGQPLVAAVQRDNFRGVQFHPERSGAVGKKILANFLRLR